MKKMIMMATTLVLATAASVAHADVSGMAGNWAGTGTVYTLDGNAQGAYAVTFADTLQSDGSVASAVTVEIPGQANKEFEYLFRNSSHGFSMVSDQGTGGAICVAEDLCEGYFGDSDGNGVAMTIIIDGANAYRILKTQLKGYRATALYFESYVRQTTQN